MPPSTPAPAFLIECALSGNSPLHRSVEEGHFEACNLLLSVKANVNKKGPKYRACLFMLVNFFADFLFY